MRKIIPLLLIAFCFTICQNAIASDYSNSNPIQPINSSDIGAVLLEDDCETFEAPYFDDLDGESWVPGTNFFNSDSEIDGCWENVPDSQLFWGTKAGNTNTSGTGPSNDVSGDGNYVFLNSFSGVEGETASIQGPVVDISSTVDPVISFYYHMFGANMGTLSLEVREEGETEWTEVFSLSGQQQTSSDDDWIQEIVELENFDAATTIEFRFVGEKGNGSAGNMAIDEIFVGPAPTCFNVENLAFDLITENSIELEWDVEPSATSGYVWEVYAFGNSVSGGNPNLSGQVDAGVDNLTIQGLQPGTIYTLVFKSDCGDEDGLSSGITIEFETECGVVTAPYVETFDSPRWIPGSAVNNQDMEIDECWENDEPVENFFWGTRSAGTGTDNTGPNQDFNGGGNYIYLRTSSNSSIFGETATFSGPAVELENLDEPSISFYYHMFGASMGTLSLEVRSLGETEWVEVFSISGQQQESSNDFWEEVVADITDFANETIEFRFLGQAGNGSTSQMAIDNLSVQEAPSCFNLTEFDVLGGDVFANASWNNSPSATEGFIINIYEAGADINEDEPLFTEIAEPGTSQFEITGLEPLNNYLATIQADCGEENGLSNLRQAIFSTFNTGDSCGAAITIDEVPFSDSDSTSNYTSIYSGSPGSECNTTANHLNQNDVVYKYTAEENGGLDVTLSNISANNAGVFVYQSCDDIGDFCLDGFGNVFANGTSNINLIEVPVEAGEDYFIVVSHTIGNNIDYTLDVDFISCSRPFGLDTEITGVGEVELSWIASGNETQWEVEYGISPAQQGDEGNQVVLADQESIVLSDLESTTNYRFWVRGICDAEEEEYSVWVGPNSFRSPIVPIEIAEASMHNEVYCYGNNEFREWLFVSSADPIEEELIMEWNAGSVEDLPNSNDVLLIYDGFNDEGDLLWDTSSDGANLAGINFVSTSGSFYMMLTTDIAQSCQGGQGELPQEFDIDVISPSFSNEEFNNDNFNFYPNPVENQLNINAVNVIDNIEMFDISGRKVKSFKPKNNQTQLNLEGIQTGTYIMRVEINGAVENFKVIKK